MLGDDWTVDEADPDVGIFGDSVYHECAGNDAADDPEPATADSAYRLDEIHPDLVVEVTTYTCPTCKATATLTSQWPRHMFEEPRDGDDS